VSASAADVDPRARVRRRDREKDDGWIRALLTAAPHGFLALVGPDGSAHLNSNIFVFDEGRHCIYLHTHRTGRTRESVEREERVTFGVALMGRMLPAPEALSFSVEYAGATVFGRGRVVDTEDEARRGLQLLLDKYAPHLRPGRDYRPITDEELRRTAVFRIDIDAWSGKQKEVEEDFPGAYALPSPTIPFPSRTLPVPT